MGMGGAFIAVADDATAASWNPGGLTQLRKPEISFVYSYFKRHEDLSLNLHPESSGNHTISIDDLNYLSVVYPFKLFERNMVVSLNYQLLYEFDRDYDMNYNTELISPDFVAPHYKEQKKHFSQQGQLQTLSPAYAIQITPRLALGVTLNFWTDKLFWSNGWTTTEVREGREFHGNELYARSKEILYDRYTDFSGFNMNMGFLWKINTFLSIGAVFKTPFTAHLTHRSTTTSYLQSPGQPITKGVNKFREDVDLRMPYSYGFGIAWRFSDAFTMSFDLYVTDWSKFFLDDDRGNRYSPITGNFARNSHVKDTTQVRLGAEYLFILTNTVIPVRGGLFYDPEPAEGHPQDFWGFSLGTGISIKNVILDCAYQFRYGKDVVKDSLTGIPGAKADVTQHLFLTSVIYHF